MFIEKQSVWFGLGVRSAERVRVMWVYTNASHERWVKYAKLAAPGGSADLPAAEFTSQFAPQAVRPQETFETCAREARRGRGAAFWTPEGARFL